MTLKEQCSQCGKAVEAADCKTMENGKLVCVDCYNIMRNKRLVFHRSDIISASGEPEPFYTECPKNCQQYNYCLRVLNKYPSHGAARMIDDIENGKVQVIACVQFARLVELFYKHNTGYWLDDDSVNMLYDKVKTSLLLLLQDSPAQLSHKVKQAIFRHEDRQFEKEKRTLETFESGAVRYPTGRRYDLISAEVIGVLLKNTSLRILIKYLLTFHQTNDTEGIHDLIHLLMAALAKQEHEILDLYAKALDEGAGKYGERNWEKGIPESNLVNHAIAHAIKLQAGDTSEDHESHVVWNVLTIIHFRLIADTSETRKGQSDET